MVSVSSGAILHELVERLKQINPKLAENLEIENLISNSYVVSLTHAEAWTEIFLLGTDQTKFGHDKRNQKTKSTTLPKTQNIMSQQRCYSVGISWEAYGACGNCQQIVYIGFTENRSLETRCSRKLSPTLNQRQARLKAQKLRRLVSLHR